MTSQLPRFYIQTFGCQMNEADSDAMGRILRTAGYEPTESPEEASFILLNTCCVRAKPEQKVLSRLGELRFLKEKNPKLILAMAGCMAQKEGEALLKKLPYLDLVIGTRQFHRLGELIHACQQTGRRMTALGLEDDPAAARATSSGMTVSPVPSRVEGGMHDADLQEAKELRQHAIDLHTGKTDLHARDGRATLDLNLKAFVPIILGCDNFCTYCIVPTVRGRQKSRSIAEIRTEVETLVAQGTREVTLLGQNVLAYGRDLEDQTDFTRLLEVVNDVPGIERIRFTTAHPRDVNDRLIDTAANLPHVCEHFHLPIQSGHDRVLRAMGRGYTTAYYMEMVEKIRAKMPDVAITTDIMVGFPGETEEEFDASLEFYKQVKFDQAFVFIYSTRPGTPAAKMPEQLPYKTKQARLLQVMQIITDDAIRVNEKWVGCDAEVLVDGVSDKDPDRLAGRLRNNKQVVFPGPAELTGKLVQVHITKAHLWGLTGEIKK